MKLPNKTVLITGAAHRLGRSMAFALAQAGCAIALHYHRSENDAREALNAFRACGVNAEGFQADFSDPNVPEALMQAVVHKMGPVEILINNASIYPKANALNSDNVLLEQVFQVNLFAPLALSRAFVHQLPENKSGHIINLCDAATRRAQHTHFAYRLSKTALLEATKSLALELAPRVQVNALALGTILPAKALSPDELQSLSERRIPLQRPCTPDDLTASLLYLLNQDFLTGTVLQLDGGEYL